MENLGKQTGTRDKYNHQNTRDRRISDADDTITKIDTLIKENIKSNKFLTLSIQEIWDTMKRPNLKIVGIQEREELQLKGTENIFN